MSSEIDLKMLNILISSKADLREFSSSLGRPGFFGEEYRTFYIFLDRYFKVYGSPPTLDTLLEHCAKDVQWHDHIIDTWKEIEENPTDSKEFPFILHKMKMEYNYNTIIEYNNDIANHDAEDVDWLNNKLFKLHKDIASLNAKQAYKISDLDKSSEEWAARFKARQANKSLSQGVLTGFSMLDYYTDGIRPAELWVVAGDTGGGKSIFLANIAKNMWMGENIIPSTRKELEHTAKENLWKTGHDILFITLEMPEEEVQDRILSCMCDIDSLKLMKGKVDAEEAKRLALALRFRQMYPYTFTIADVPRGCSTADIQLIFDDATIRHGRKPKVVVVDYLGLMADLDDNSEDWLKLKHISESLHEFGRINDVGCVTAVQVKTSKPGTEGVGLHRIGRSSLIMHDVNLGLQIEMRDNEDMRPDAPIHCIKFRRGPRFVMNNLRKAFMHTKFIDGGFTPDGASASTSTGNDDLTEMMEDMLNDN